ncbi:MAG: hypothetical protein ACYTXY_45560 [Nostoc sp.]
MRLGNKRRSHLGLVSGAIAFKLSYLSYLSAKDFLGCDRALRLQDIATLKRT